MTYTPDTDDPTLLDHLTPAQVNALYALAKTTLDAIEDPDERQ